MEDESPASGVSGRTDDVKPAGDAPEQGAGTSMEVSDAGGEGAAEARLPFWKRMSKPLIAAYVVLIAFGATWVVLFCIIIVCKLFTGAEGSVRSDWTVDTGALIEAEETYDVDVYEASAEATIDVLQIQPADVDDEDFTYYDTDVQDRLAGEVELLKAEGGWTVAAPLAILNPYGTGSNGLYLYFETDEATEASYVIQAEGTTDFEATATGGYATEHEFQMIGLVPGLENHVTLTLEDEDGQAVEVLEFDIDMPDNLSGYDVQLDSTDGESTQELSSGLYVMMRVNGTLGYGFFYDNDGTMRYELVTEGFGLDRIVEYEGDIVTCISNTALARIDGLGRVVQVYDLDGYVLHHDINDAEDGKLLVLAEHEESEEELVEDLVLELDLETGEFYELVDFSDLMADYRENFTRSITMFDPFAWQAGEWDWIHLNTVQYIVADDSIIVSSRETSTIIKVTDVHDDPEVDWLCGDPDFWEGTPYEDLCLEPVGDFKFQWGQHTVEYVGAGDEDGVYYLSLYDNNYWGLSTRDDFSPDLTGDTDETYTNYYTQGYEHSNVYVYKIDENEGTFELVFSFQVPYSSIVSNAALTDAWTTYGTDTQDEAYDIEGRNWVACSGVDKVFGEYDSDGNLIREFSFKAVNQNYRVFKYTFEGFWFADEAE